MGVDATTAFELELFFIMAFEAVDVDDNAGEGIVAVVGEVTRLFVDVDVLVMMIATLLPPPRCDNVMRGEFGLETTAAAVLVVLVLP